MVLIFFLEDEDYKVEDESDVAEEFDAEYDSDGQASEEDDTAPMAE